ncbi:ABC transporter permease [Desulfovibrio ferrophilus]|uniref:Inner-membrane translocator n=1 Tax=Desulfovibrio ferrophilus TaxID=241368 RepID=A0A2Z6AUW7_9BACT|nr:ABC transporter permease [Desulfovibrio ferrophilus]BBD07023.1 inner-membrane translocator [Desulfovibrio ferrophilus]
MFGFIVIKRQEPPKWGSFLIFPAALALSLGASCLLLAIQGKPALDGLTILYQGAFGAGYAVVDTLLKTVPIFLCSLGVAVAFRMQVWNIGAEGQFALGAIGATWAALTFPALPAWLLLPLMFTSAAVLGGIWAMIPAWLKLKLSINEIITTLMLNYIGILILDYLVYGPWKDPSSFGFPMTKEFPAAAIVPAFEGSRLHWGMILCLVCALLLWVFLTKTRLGYELKASGESLRASRYARMPYGFLVLLVMGLCGALAGWAGLMETSAVVGRLQPSLMVGYGYTAIVVAWLAQLNPGKIALASFFLAALRVGVENLQLELGVPAAFGGIIEGLILLSVLAGQFFNYYRFKRPSA